MNPEVRWIAVGRVSRAHGMKGEVTVLSLSDVAARFDSGSTVFVGESNAAPLTVETRRGTPQRPLIKFREIADRDAAEALAGEYLFVPVEAVPDAPEGEFWPHQLVGCAVVTASGRELGHVREVLHTPANDIWVVEHEGSETMLPALRDVVVSVALGEGRIVVADVPGLTVP